MWNWIKRIFSRETYDEAAAEQWYEEKSNLMEHVLGKEHDMVMHSLIPYAVGGALHGYYYPNGIEGVGIATKDLSTLPRKGSNNDFFDCYELVMFTREKFSFEEALDKSTSFGQIHHHLKAILNVVAPYGAQATLNPAETCEFPEDMEEIGGKCLIFDRYGSFSDSELNSFGMMVVIEVFRREMNYARQKGGNSLIKRLKKAGHYPYSDLDRDSVV
ncbi:suppressor of fused domain protein [Gimesia aquarii]|uniref:Uncharacterized protein n=1 Tax=Gimesia aquarii TaxID=2527964 RepID=A0A517WW04_9PLAN|nr:suppressor of fused domain protein [Gimesia aquarii]QDU09418.1 hypothetical protein V202x_27930 [Gimesia aquarii]